jgi:hypothetical protein
MGLLSNATKTHSSQSWKDIDGFKHVFVQVCTGDYVRRCHSVARRISFSAPDLFRFRIIMVEGKCTPSRYSPSSAGAKQDHVGDELMKATSKYVIAAGQSKAEILKDWNDIRNFTDAGSLTSRSWAATYQHLQDQKRCFLELDSGRSVPQRSPHSSSPSVTTASTSDRSAAAAPSHGPSSTSLSAPLGVRNRSIRESAAMQQPAPAAIVKELHSEGPLDSATATIHPPGELPQASTTEVKQDDIDKLTIPSPQPPRPSQPLEATDDAQATVNTTTAVSATLPQRAVPARAARVPYVMLVATALVLFLGALLCPTWNSLVLLAAAWGLIGIAAGVATAAPRFAPTSGRVSDASQCGRESPPDKETSIRPEATPRTQLRCSSASSTDSTPSTTAGSLSAVGESRQRSSECAPMPDAVRRALELVAGKTGTTKWQKPKGMHGVAVQTGVVPWTPWAASKFHILMPDLRALTLLNCIYDDPDGVLGRKSRIFQIEDTLADRHLIRRIGPSEAIWYAAFAAPFPGIAGRDFVNRVHPFTILTPEIRKEYSLTDAPGFVYAAESYEGDGTPAPNPPYVRGKMYRYGVVVQDLPNDQGVEFTSVVSINPNGHIPAMTVPLVNRDTSKRLRNLESFARNLERNSNPRPEAIRDPPAPVAAEKPKTERPKTQAALEERTREPAVSEPSSIADGIPVQHTPVQVDKALTLMNETGWQDKGEKEGCTWEAKAVPYSTAEAGRFRIFMAGVHAANLAEMLDDDPELTKGKQSTERHICGLALKKLVSHGPDAGEPLATCVDYKTRRLFPTVHPRDFPARVVGRYFLNEAEKAEYRVGHPGCDVFVTAAIHDPDIPQAKKYVRGTMHVFGIVASDRPDGTGCDVVQVVANELGGSLPVSVVNGVAGGQMDKLNMLHALFRSLKAKAGRLPSPGPTRPYAAGNVPDPTDESPLPPAARSKGVVTPAGAVTQTSGSVAHMSQG